MAPGTQLRASHVWFWHKALRNPFVLWGSFLLVHIVLGRLALDSPGTPLGDVTQVYKSWALDAQSGMAVVGLDTPWVYPILALIPVMLPLLAGPENYAGAWLTMVLLVNVAAFAVLLFRANRRAVIAAWWWLGFLLLLGPIALTRLDSISMSIAVVALLWLGSHPRWAAVLLTVVTWIKVWPAALLASVVIATKHRIRTIAIAASGSVAIVALGLAFGQGLNIFSFITEQTGRGLQIEAPVSTVWMWQAAFGKPGTFVYYDRELLTFQVTGDGISTAIALMTPLLALAVIVTLLVGIRAMISDVPALSVLPTLGLALVTTLIAFNKVGSPQYVTWLVPPVILGILSLGRIYRTPAILVVVVAALTQLIYPYLYNDLLATNTVMVGVLTVRNLLVFVILGWALWRMWHEVHLASSPHRKV